MTKFIDRFDAVLVSKVCGFQSVAMIDYLERTGVFLPTIRRRKRRGKKRNYTFRDMLVLKAINSLLMNGASVASLKLALHNFQNWRWKADPATLEDRDGGLKYLIASGTEVFFARSENTLMSLTKNGQYAFSFILDLDRLHSDLCVDLGLQQQEELGLSETA